MIDYVYDRYMQVPMFVEFVWTFSPIFKDFKQVGGTRPSSYKTVLYIGYYVVTV